VKKLLLWGAGGHGKVVLDTARAAAAFHSIAFIDDKAGQHGSQMCGCPVFGVDRLALLKQEGYQYFVVCIGDNHLRAAGFHKVLAHGLEAATLVDPSAVVSPSARIGRGTVILRRVVVNADAEIGENCIINTGAIVEHDCRVAAHVHLSPGSVLGGGVKIGAFAHLGIGAIALPGAEVGAESVVGAGGVVLDSLPEGVTAVGVPARVLAGRRK